MAKRERGDHAGGDADIAAGEAIKPDIAEEFRALWDEVIKQRPRDR